MLQRLYVHNFRCLQNFEIKPGDHSSILLIGKNGTGKSTMAQALLVLRQIGAGVSSVSDLVKKDDFTLGRTGERMIFEIETLINNINFQYRIIFDLPDTFKKLRIVEENLFANNEPVYMRNEARVSYKTSAKNSLIHSEFSLDWHSVALPLITERHEGPLHSFCTWLQQMLILTPIPPIMKGESRGSSDPLSRFCDNIADYVTTLFAEYPSSYADVKEYVQTIIHDMKDITNEKIASDTRQLRIVFESDDVSFKIDFDRLSDGEKCIFLCAVILAVKNIYTDIFVFWDEPDNYLALSEVESFIRRLRQQFTNKNRIWMTSHNEETMNCFSHENTILMSRKNHIDPVVLRPVSEVIGPAESTVRTFRLNEFD